MRGLATAAVLAFAFTAIGAAPPQGTLRGYTYASSAQERATELQFVDIPSVQGALDTAAAIGERPHYAGSSGDYALALYMRDALRAAGFSADLERVTARVDTPRELSLALAPGDDRALSGHGRRPDKTAFPIVLPVAESAEPSDPATAARGIGLPFNAGSADGDVRAPLVYAAHGLEADYTALAQAAVDVRGAVVLVRYGAEFRGSLASRAQTHGAAGVLFYSDPQDDGSARGAVYPNGPWRPPTAIQRGWVGDGLRIPTLPISADNAAVLLRSLHGIAGPTGWSGALPVAYPLARGPGRVHLIVKLTRKPTTLWNTIGVIAGIHPDQSVILGAHRDAWVYGVGDNGDGVATMLEVARGLGFLVRGGWRPQRSIVIAGWDGEEIGLVGSRSYERLHAIELQRGCIAYLNADENVTGPQFGADSAAAIAPLIVDAAHAVRDPAKPGTTIYDRWAAQSPTTGPQIAAPGGGSDHESFLFEAGIPSANIGFHGPFGVYHSSYDTVRYAKLFGDPDFTLHRAAAQLYGLVALRLADAQGLPYSFAGYVAPLRAGLAKIALRAQRENLVIDPAPLRRAVDAFGYSVARNDPASAPSGNDTLARQLRAVHLLNSLIYGIDDSASVAFPDIDAAFAAHDLSVLNSAIERAADVLGRATDALAPTRS